jgi:DNA-binding LacI/PurR family transcriptional regulator
MPAKVRDGRGTGPASGSRGRFGDSGKPTIRSVAERAEVAISTVSRVVNGGRASAAVQRKVRRAIEELGYSPSVAARSLVTRRAGCIGLAVNSSQSPWFSQILAGIEESLAASHNSVLLSSMMLNGSYDPSTVQSWIQDRRVDGLILVRHSLRDQPLLDAAHAAGLPVVLLAPDMDAAATFSVRSNNLEAGRLAAAHQADHGQPHLALAGGPRESVVTRKRRAGIEETLSARGLCRRSEDTWLARE